jgi:hypothetical protein
LCNCKNSSKRIPFCSWSWNGNQWTRSELTSKLWSQVGHPAQWPRIPGWDLCGSFCSHGVCPGWVIWLLCISVQNVSRWGQILSSSCTKWLWSWQLCLYGPSVLRLKLKSRDCKMATRGRKQKGCFLK